MTPLALFLLSHGARTIPSSRLTKELIHLGYRPVCFTTWYENPPKVSAANEGLKFERTKPVHHGPSLPQEIRRRISSHQYSQSGAMAFPLIFSPPER